MRWLAILVAVLATLYGGYWFYGRSAVTDGIQSALTEAEGGQYDISYDDWGTKGFPSRFDTTFTGLKVLDRASGVVWEAPWVQIFALAYRPNEVIAVWPDEQTLTVDGETLTLLTSNMRASAKVSANTSLAFNQARIEIDNPRLRREADGAELAIGRVMAAARITPDTESDYDIFLDASSIVLPAHLRALLDPEDALPPLIRQLRIDSVAGLDRPLDRFAGEGDPVGIERIEIREVAAIWGDISISAIGEVTAGPDGVAEGSITLSAANWRQALDMAVAAGAIEEGFDETYASMAQSLDETPHIPDVLTVTLTFADGQSKLGPMPLGPAPRLN